MEKTLLVPLDDSRASKLAVKYAVQIAEQIKNLSFVLFHVQPAISLYLQEEAGKDLHLRAQLNQRQLKNEAAAMAMLNTHKSEMTAAGIPDDHISLVTRSRQAGLAQDVIEYGQAHLVDAILVGRRGISGIQKFFSASVSDAVLERSQVIPVWMVQDNARSYNILVAVDGSESSLRAVDHAAFMVSGNEDMSLTLLHVTHSAQNYCTIDLDEEPDPEFKKWVDQEDQKCLDRFYPLAMEKAANMGLSDRQIRFESIRGGRKIADAVVSYAAENKFDTIVMGRKGINKSFFMGSVSRDIIERNTGAALWVVS